MLFVSPETLSALNSDLLLLEANFFIVCSLFASFSLRHMTETTASGLQQIGYAVDRGVGADMCVLQTVQTVGAT
jgi:hypothetical protein